MDDTTYEDDQGLSNSAGIRGTSRRESVAALEEKMSYPTISIDIDRDIGNFFYDLKPACDAGVGLTEQTVDYIADVKGEPEWIVSSAKMRTASSRANRFRHIGPATSLGQ